MRVGPWGSNRRRTLGNAGEIEGVAGKVKKIRKGSDANLKAAGFHLIFSLEGRRPAVATGGSYLVVIMHYPHSPRHTGTWLPSYILMCLQREGVTCATPESEFLGVIDIRHRTP